MRKVLLTGMSLFCMSLLTYAQKVSRIESGKKGMHPEFIEFDASDAPSFRNGNLIVLRDNRKPATESNTILISNRKDELGFEHFQYQQTHNNIPVEDAYYVVHVKSGKVLMENGNLIKDFPGNSSAASVSESAALTSALKKVNAVTYKWQDADDETFLKAETGNRSATFYPKAKLVYYAAGDEFEAENLRLAFKFDIYAKEPLSRQYVFVDAHTGAVLGTKELIHTADADGTAVTAFSGTQAIKTTVSSGSYILRETGRGKGIMTLNLRGSTSYSGAVDFKDGDNNWNNVNSDKDQYATDAHWGAEKTYDFFLQKFGRNSIDDNGFAIRSYVHYSTNYLNAFWDGSRMTYGDGNSTDGYKPLTAIDICGHEITHGLTSFTANLNYSNQSGALNEGFSDIFGTSVEWFARPSQHDWLIGGDFWTIRSMSNPNAYQQPDTYKGKYWYTGTGDNGGVHYNSGVLNFWFYLLCTGGSGTNDNGFTYNVRGLNMAKAQAIAYRTLTTYLVSTSQYRDARKYSIKSAEDLYGVDSKEAKQTAKAWDAVGVTATTTHVPVTNTQVTSATSLTGDIKVSKLYPNPAQNHFTIEFTSRQNETRNIAVYDLSGSTVYSRNVAATKGNNKVEITLKNVINGNYIVKIDNKESVMFTIKK